MFESMKIECLNYNYSAEQKILNNLFLNVKKNEIVGILGRNGSGKTTFFNALTVFSDYLGSVFINDSYVSRTQLINRVGYLPQVNFLPNEKRVKYVISMFPIKKEKRENIFNNQRIINVLDQKVVSLSGGERRYLEFLLVNSLDRDIMILDEPFSEIEPIYEKAIFDDIMKYFKDRVYIITDHKFEIIKKLCTQLYLLQNGELRKISSEDELIEYGYLSSRKKNLVGNLTTAST